MAWLGWVPRNITREITCAWCGAPFIWEGDADSDPPRFCRTQHKTAANKARARRLAALEPKPKKAADPKPPDQVAVTCDPEPVNTEPFCGCRNHMGGVKQKYPSQQEAVTAIMRRHIQHGPHGIYRCPTSDVWHVTSRPRTEIA